MKAVLMQNTMFLTAIIKFKLSNSLAITFGAGIFVVFLSLFLKFYKGASWQRIIIRDILMIFLIGFLFPLLYIFNLKNSFADFGLHFDKWYFFLFINFIFAILLLLMFIKKKPISNYTFDPTDIYISSYILLVGIFEVIFFYGFMRTIFEYSLGLFPAIILTALFYSLHHAGFQPEFIKLFFVGLMYAIVYRVGNSIFLIYPFF